MKPTILLFVLLSPSVVLAQTPPKQMTDKLCDQLGRIHVTDKNKDESVPGPGQSWYWSFVAAHHDSNTNSCYVMYDRFVQLGDKVLEQIKIDDIGGNRFAVYSGIWTSDRNGRPTYSRPTNCEVSGISCVSMSEFEDLLEKFIPAFRKNTPSGPLSG